MGNITNTELWAAMERLRFIERAAFWTGTVNRSDLIAVFGVSQAQSSSDLQKYQQLNPGAIVYNLNRKRYEGTPAMRCALHEPRLEEAMAQFLGEASASLPRLRGVNEAEAGARLAVVALPVREAGMEVKRAVFQAVLHGLRLHVHYRSMSGKKGGWRWIAPHAFAHDGYRWHTRAWCEDNRSFRDFVLSRMEKAELPVEAAVVPEQDAEWEAYEEIVVGPAAALSEDNREAVALDFGMRGGKLRLRVRKAMKRYLLKHLRLPVEEGTDVEAFLERLTGG